MGGNLQNGDLFEGAKWRPAIRSVYGSQGNRPQNPGRRNNEKFRGKRVGDGAHKKQKEKAPVKGGNLDR